MCPQSCTSAALWRLSSTSWSCSKARFRIPKTTPSSIWMCMPRAWWMANRGKSPTQTGSMPSKSSRYLLLTTLHTFKTFKARCYMESQPASVFISLKNIANWLVRFHWFIVHALFQVSLVSSDGEVLIYARSFLFKSQLLITDLLIFSSALFIPKDYGKLLW